MLMASMRPCWRKFSSISARSVATSFAVGLQCCADKVSPQHRAIASYPAYEPLRISDWFTVASSAPGRAPLTSPDPKSLTGKRGQRASTAARGPAEGKGSCRRRPAAASHRRRRRRSAPPAGRRTRSCRSTFPTLRQTRRAMSSIEQQACECQQMCCFPHLRCPKDTRHEP